MGSLQSSLILLTDVLRVLAGMQDAVEGNAFAAHAAANAIRAVVVVLTVFIGLKLLLLLARLKAAWEALTLAVLAFRIAMLNPITATVTILGALAAAFVLIAREVSAADKETKKYLETLKELREISTDITGINTLLAQATEAGDTTRIISLLGQQELKVQAALEKVVKSRAEGFK